MSRDKLPRPLRIWISLRDLDQSVLQSYPETARFGVGVSMGPQRPHDPMDDSECFCLLSELTERETKARHFGYSEAVKVSDISTKVLIELQGEKFKTLRDAVEVMMTHRSYYEAKPHKVSEIFDNLEKALTAAKS